MFGTYYYNQHLRNITAVFGTLFNNIHVVRSDGSGKVVSQEKVPIEYGPRDKYLSRLKEQSDFDDTKLAITLPRMSYEITGIEYDSDRQLNKRCTETVVAPSNNNAKRGKIYSPTPYILSYELNIMTKTFDEGAQIIEQIIPNFSPSLGLTIKPLKDFSGITEDINIILNSVNLLDEYEGDYSQRRRTIFTLSFKIMMNFQGNVREGSVIKSVTVNIKDFDNSTLISGLTTSVNPQTATQDDSYTIDVTSFGFE